MCGAKAREGRNPRTKEPIKIPASKNVRFKIAKICGFEVASMKAKKK